MCSSDRTYSKKTPCYGWSEGNAGIIENASMIKLELRWCRETGRYSRWKYISKKTEAKSGGQ